MAVVSNKKYDMCKFNSECISNDGQCSCEGKSEQYTSNHSNGRMECGQLPNPLLPSQNLIFSIYRTLQKSADLVKIISEQTRAAAGKLDRIINKLDGLPYCTSEARLDNIFIPSGEFTSSQRLQDILCKGKIDFRYRIKLASSIPEPAYKERAFEIIAVITDLEGNQAVIPKPTTFKVLLFTTESPPKLLRLNTSGDKIMRGIIEQESSSEIHFSKVVIKEVTSHFRNGCVLLVIASTEETDIQPLIVESFVVKARKMNGENETRKKLKYECNSSD